MPSLTREQRKQLESKIVAARHSAVAGARKALIALRIGDKESAADPEQRSLRHELRAHGRQLGDCLQRDGAQETSRLEQACAYEHWHRMLFARFLAENDLLVNPEYGVAMSLAEVQDTARENNQDWISLASDYAQRMLLEVFRPDDPVLRVTLPPETRQELERLLGELPAETFTADDSLGWVYQFWQRDEKERVNKSEVKIGADELSPVTQLFTEDYMVLFVLHNTLGAWWTAKRLAEGKTPQLPGYAWTYLRLNEDGSPAAGSFEGWPSVSREIRVLDPCMGSGHFLTFTLPILALMRQEEEGLSLTDAVKGTIGENLFGLELDGRCSQIAAFNLALTAWRMVGHPTDLPPLNLARAGIGINASLDEWLKLAGKDGRQRDWMEQLYALFRLAPTLGSLIDPTRIAGPVFASEFATIRPLLEAALRKERNSERASELSIAASGLLAAAEILASKFTLVVTNVPYLGRGGQSEELRRYCDENHSDAKADLGICMFDRCIRFCADGGTTALVALQSWLFMGPYKDFRTKLLKHTEWNFVARLGAHAFETITGEVVNVALCCVTRDAPGRGHLLFAIDAADEASATEKAAALTASSLVLSSQTEQLSNPDARFVVNSARSVTLLSDYADSYKGIATGDLPRFIHQFWEMPRIAQSGWEFLQGAVRDTQPYGARDEVVLWENGHGALYRYVAEKLGESGVGAWIRGAAAWGKKGVAVAQMSTLTCSLYTGELFDENTGAIIPRDARHLSAIWAFCSSPQYRELVRSIDQSLKVPTLTLLKVPFDLQYWDQVAMERSSGKLPEPDSNDPTQWLFPGDPVQSTLPLHVAVARLLGYLWPRQTGSCFPDCLEMAVDALESQAETSGILCLNSVSGEAPASARLRSLLASAYGPNWSAAKLTELLDKAESLELWLRDLFFEEHCALFHNRPFIWHVWDGRKDGFHALVNYHKLAAPNGEGRRTLEKLIYSSLGDWIKRQRDEVSQGKDGAEGRLAAALHLHSQLENILEGEADPERNAGYDIFIRWKPIHEQPIGWEPDLNDGVRLNVRPWLIAKPYREPNQKLKQGACILRITPIKLPLGKDRGKEPSRDKGEFPWFATGQDRTNDEHLTLEQKRAARERKKRG